MPERIFSEKYVVQEEIAKGGMGVIYKALDRTLNRLVAIKVIHEQFSGDSSFTERFIREARAMARLHHENIVTIFSVEEDQGDHFIVMEYFPGMDLRARIKTRQSLTVRESVDVALQVATALAFAHSQSIVHRDIKPANILVDTRGRVKLTDFGIAAALDEASITSAGQIIGTPEYMSPEQAGGRAIDGRTDLYSLGIVLHEMLLGQTPFRSMPKTSILVKLLDPEYEIPLTFSPEVPSGVQAILEDLIRREPEHRTPRAAILVSQLKECLISLPLLDSDDAPTVIAKFPPSLASRTMRVGTIPPAFESRTLPFQQKGEPPLEARPHSPASQIQSFPSASSPQDEATDILPRSKLVSKSSPQIPVKQQSTVTDNRVPMAVGMVSLILILTGTTFFLSRSDHPLTSSENKTSETPSYKAETGIEVGQAPDRSSSMDSAQLEAKIEAEQQKLIVDQARVETKRREAEGLQKKEREEASKLAKAAEDQRKKKEEAARSAHERQQAEQRRFVEEQKRLENEKVTAAKQAQAAEEQRRKAQEDARAAREREEFEARRGKEEADMKRLQAERQRLEKDRELAEEHARLAEAQRKKAEADARIAREQHEAEQLKFHAEQQRLEKDKELAAQRYKLQEEERRKTEEEARITRERLDAEQKRLQAERDRLEREKELAAQKARLETEERRKAQEETHAARQRYEAEQKQLLRDRDRLEKEKREAVVAQQARLEEAERKGRIAQDEDRRKNEELTAKVTPDGMTNAASRRQLRDLLEEFKRAYEKEDLEALERLSEMGNDRMSFVRTMFNNYRTIQVSIQSLNVIDEEASATLIHDVLINNNGEAVKPSPILRSARIKIRKTGDKWTKIEW